MDDAIVIGGGLAGLATANLLADAGLTVTLLEARGRLGGRATTDERDGHRFNQGPHALYLEGEGLAVLRSLGREPAGWVPPAAGGLGLAGGRLDLLPAGPGTLARTGLLSPADKVAVGRLLGRLPRLDPSALAGGTAEEWITSVTGRPRVRDLVRGLTRLTTYCADLDRLSAAVAVRQIQRGLGGVLYVDGGWQCLIDGLADRARRAGVTVTTGAVVESITTGQGPGDEVTVTTRSGVHRARAVVVAGLPPVVTARIVGSDDLAARAAAAVPVRAASLDVGLRRLPRPDRRFVLGIDRPLYFSVHSPAPDLGRDFGPDHGASPGPAVTLHVMRYLDRHDGPDAGDVRAELEALLDLVQPGWRAELVTSRFQRRLTVAHAVPGPRRDGGSPAGEDHAAGDHAAVSPRLPDRPGVFVAGDWVGPTGHLADASLASARAAAEAVVADRAAARAGATHGAGAVGR